jgi:ATP-dependent Lhr-like helicase
LPESLLEPVRDPAGDLALRYARSHGPFTARTLAARFGLGLAVVDALLRRLTESGKLIEGEFRPGGSEREWIDPDVLRSLRRRSLAKLRHEVEPVEADALGRFMMTWHGIGSHRRGLEALLDAIEQLQGAPVPASVLEREILPARVDRFNPAMLDTLMAAGEVMWVGLESLGEHDGRVALYLTDHFPRLRGPATSNHEIEGRAEEILAYLRKHGASFFAAIHQGTGGGFPQETVDGLWELVWKGVVGNDTLHPLRAYVHVEDRRTARKSRSAPFRSRRLVPPTAEGRWSALDAGSRPTSPTEYMTALAQQLLTRHGVVTRETVTHEAVTGGFSTVYQILKAMEDSGRVRRGYFVAGLGGAQFAMPAALDLLRSMRDVPDEPRTVLLTATDPANPYGSVLKWPDLGSGELDGISAPPAEGGRGPTRTVGSMVILVDGAAAGYLRRGERELLLFLPEAEPRRSTVTREVARILLHLAAAREEGRRGMLIGDINDMPATAHPAARVFIEEGFIPTAMGLQARITRITGSPYGRSAPQPHAGDGTGIAESWAGGVAMPDNTPNRVPDDETRGVERENVPPPNDLNQEREGTKSKRHRGRDEREPNQKDHDIDPDSPDSDVDRDDMIDEP